MYGGSRKYPYLPTEGDLFTKTPHTHTHTPLRKFQLSLIHFFICFDVREPPTPQVFQSLLSSMGGQYGYFLKLYNNLGYMYASFIIMYTFGQTCFKCQGNNHYAKKDLMSAHQTTGISADCTVCTWKVHVHHQHSAESLLISNREQRTTKYAMKI